MLYSNKNAQLTIGCSMLL